MDLKEYVSKNKKQITGWRDYLKQVDWTTIEVYKITEDGKGEVLDEKKTSEKKKREFKLQHGIANNVYKRLKHLTETYNIDRKKPQYISFLNLCLSVLNTFIKTAEDYDLNIDLLSIESDFLREQELELQTDIFGKVSKIREDLTDLDISTDSEVGTINFHTDKKAPLILHDKLSIIYPQILDKVKELGVDPEREPPQVMHIHNKKPPVWDMERHYFEQDRPTLQYWFDEVNKCKKGVTVDGVYISGWMYFHINHFVTKYPTVEINPKTGLEEQKDITGIPPLRDNEWWIINDNYEEARKTNKMMFIAATRRAAKTTLNTSHIGWCVVTGRQNILLAGGSSDDLGHIKDNFEVLEQSISPALRWHNLVNDWTKFVDLGIKTKEGKNIIIARIKVVNLDGGADKKSESLAGFTPSAVIIDEIMKIRFKKQLEGLRPALGGGGSMNRCVVMLTGTAGSADLAQDAFDYLRDPDMYDVLNMNWELFNSRVPEEYRTWKERPFGTFLPGQMSVKTGIIKQDSDLATYLKIEGKNLSKIKLKVTDWKQSLEVIKADRKKKEKDLEAYTKEVLYHPICPSDMLLSGKVNPFPVAEAIAHRERLKAEGGRGTKCYLTQNPETGEIEIQLSNNQLPDYPWKGGFIDAPVVLYEPLPKEKPADNLYVSSLDDYKQDEAGTDSVGSFHIYKVDVGMDKNCGKIVASLATRPDPHGKFHRQIYLLQQAFNARCLMENADMDYKTYLEGKRVADIWLQETLDFDSDMTRQGTNRRKYGWTPTPKNKKNLLSQFINYCKREFTTYNEDGDEITVLGVERIDDIGLLDEIIAYSEDNNVDRITSAMGCLGFESYLSANYLLPNFNKNLIERRESNRRTNNSRPRGGMFPGRGVGLFR